MKKVIVLLTLFSFLLTAQNGFSCAVFNAVRGNRFFIGNNEGWLVKSLPETIHKIRFVPAGNGKMGRVLLISDCAGEQTVEGGINEKGLFVDGAALAASPGMPHDRKKKSVPEEFLFLENILGAFSTTEEIKQFYNRYNFGTYVSTYQLMFVDKQGNSVIICSGKDGNIEVIEKDRASQANHQLMTNYNIANPALEPEEADCWRFKKGEEMLSNLEQELSVEYMAAICEGMAQKKGIVKTLYSTIYDPVKGDLYLFNALNFDEYVVFNIEKELAKGEKTYVISSLFQSGDDKEMTRSNLFLPAQLNRLNSQTNNANYTPTITKYYTPENRLLQESRYSYSDKGLLKGVSVYSVTKNCTTFFDPTYQKGSLVEITEEYTAGSIESKIRYTYDNASRCIQETLIDDAGKVISLTEYEYSRGDLSAKKVYDAQNKLIYTEIFSYAGNKAKNVKVKIFTAEGSLTGEREYLYGPQDRLVKTNIFDKAGNLTGYIEYYYEPDLTKYTFENLNRDYNISGGEFNQQDTISRGSFIGFTNHGKVAVMDNYSYHISSLFEIDFAQESTFSLASILYLHELPVDKKIYETPVTGTWQQKGKKLILKTSTGEVITWKVRRITENSFEIYHKDVKKWITFYRYTD